MMLGGRSLKELQTSLDKIDDKSDCKGIIFRGTTNIFSQGDIVRSTRQVKILKRESCPGCSKCYGLLDMLYEDISCIDEVGYLDNVEHGKKYMIQINSSQDWESGIWEIDDMEFVEVKGD